MGSGCWTIRARIHPTALSAFLEFSTEPSVIRLVASGLHGLFQATSLKPQGDSSAMLLRLGIRPRILQVDGSTIYRTSSKFIASTVVYENVRLHRTVYVLYGVFDCNKVQVDVSHSTRE